MQDEEAIYLTEEGLRKIEAELHQLSTVRRSEVSERIRNSREHGEFADDNSEFEEAKFDQAIVEGRIQDLRNILSVATVVRPEDIPTDRVGIGSVVTVKDMGRKSTFDLTLVGSLEADPDNDRISNASPIGEALFGCRIGEVVEVEVPAGKAKYKIEKIRK